MKADVLLTGERIDLRPLSIAEIDGPYLGWLNDSEVCRYNSHGEVEYTKEMAREYVERVTDSPEYLVLAILTKAGKHIGNISLQEINARNRAAEFAILLGDKDYWGKGFAKEASLLIIRYGFERLDLHRIYCGTSIENAAMQKLAHSLGFQEEGRRREAFFKRGAFTDVVEYGLLKSEFRAA
ncbi:MAG: GNAT family N-acetyltransferase [Candidatus Kaiserbacteria bacterium]|nr:GNAT family N-acetyltransferase [Candidatus Kaiserbacteria bacterium]